jgi:hypothetical protein
MRQGAWSISHWRSSAMGEDQDPRTYSLARAASQVKSYSTGGHLKAARKVNHRGLPGGGGLWVCKRWLQQLYGSLCIRMGWVYVRGRCSFSDFSLRNYWSLPRFSGQGQVVACAITP